MATHQFHLFADGVAVAGPWIISSDDAVTAPDGWTETTGQTVTIAASVPAEVPAWKAKALLSGMPSPKGTGNTFLADVEAAITALGGVPAIAWNGSASFARNGVLMAQIAAQFGVSDAQLDDMFRQADAITV